MITIDASHPIGTIHRLNDVDNGPLCEHGTVDLTHYYKELGVQNVRLHDVPWSYDAVLDLQYIFPDWNADPDSPASYRFTQSDYYLKTITDLGINVIFRLGYSAEGKTAVPRNLPPTSPEKFAAVSAHIARHYNQGWANGTHANIRYWEIWNEPDIPSFWSGSTEQYFRLYDVTAKALLHTDPSLLIGGPALAGHLDFLEAFLKYARAHQLPLDFISWHAYSQNPGDIVARANQINALKMQYGHANAKSILDEWNYGPSNWQSLFINAVDTENYFSTTRNATGAAFDAAVLIGLQDAHVDIATFYTGTTSIWGLFSPWGTPQKPYYAFLAFTNLLQSPGRLKVISATDNSIRLLAGISEDKQTIRILISNSSGNPRHLRLKLTGLPWKSFEYQKQTLDDHSNLDVEADRTEQAPVNLEESVPGPSVTLLTIVSSKH